MSPLRVEAAFELAPQWASIEQIVEAHAPDGVRLDLGCGYVKPQGFIGIDNLVGERTQVVDETNAPDILMDLNSFPLPFPDSSCTEVRSSHFLEHSVLDHVIDESYRVLRPGGLFLFTVPYANSAEGMYPGHSVFLTEKWFHENPNFGQKFEILEERFDPSDDYQRLPWLVRKLLPFDKARTFLFNACWQMTISARPRK
jgi:predicted SAM-dependent methyltransferase